MRSNESVFCFMAERTHRKNCSFVFWAKRRAVVCLEHKMLLSRLTKASPMVQICGCWYPGRGSASSSHHHQAKSWPEPLILLTVVFPSCLYHTGNTWAYRTSSHFLMSLCHGDESGLLFWHFGLFLCVLSLNLVSWDHFCFCGPRRDFGHAWLRCWDEDCAELCATVSDCLTFHELLWSWCCKFLAGL